MARKIVKTAKVPFEVKPQDKLKNQPFCDGSHTKTVDEKDDQVYCYENGVRVENDKKDKEACCQNGCC